MSPDRDDYLLESFRQSLDLVRANEQRLLTAIGSYFGLLSIVVTVAVAGGKIDLSSRDPWPVYWILFLVGAILSINVLWWNRTTRDYMQVARRIAMGWGLDRRYLPALLRIHRGSGMRTALTYGLLPSSLIIAVSATLFLAVNAVAPDDVRTSLASTAVLVYLGLVMSVLVPSMEGWLNADREEQQGWGADDLSVLDPPAPSERP